MIQQKVYGIYSIGTGTIDIHENTISNLKNNTSNTAVGTSGLIYGIYLKAGTNRVLENTIRQVVGNNVSLIDSGKETAKAVKDVLINHKLLNISGKSKENKFFVSDIPAKFEEIGSRFLGQPLRNVERVNFDQFLIELGSTAFSNATLKEEV